MRIYVTLVCFLGSAMPVAGAQACTLDVKTSTLTSDSTSLASFGKPGSSPLAAMPNETETHARGFDFADQPPVGTMGANPAPLINGASLHEQHSYSRGVEDRKALDINSNGVSGTFRVAEERSPFSSLPAGEWTTRAGGLIPASWREDEAQSVTLMGINAVWASFNADSDKRVLATVWKILAGAVQTAPLFLASTLSLLGIAIPAVLFIAPRSPREPHLS